MLELTPQSEVQRSPVLIYQFASFVKSATPNCKFAIIR
jgi:hypothetical protein